MPDLVYILKYKSRKDNSYDIKGVFGTVVNAETERDKLLNELVSNGIIAYKSDFIIEMHVIR